MPDLEFVDVKKSFGDVNVIKSFDTTIKDGEFLVLLGPSGCGKSTLLRMIAGLAPITSGELKIDGKVANDWDIKNRNIAFVFQSYALYTHMKVKDNIAFPLVMDRFRAWQHIPIVSAISRRRIARSADIADQVAHIAEELEITQLLEKKPAQLSGGQRQRVALARSLVRNPDLYLLDEPLSNLDAKLRVQMRTLISNLYHSVAKTFIYVTHDQVEAMTMATRIVVLNDGVVQQIGTPDEVYRFPHNTFVAKFVGSPAMNLLPVTLGDDGSVALRDGTSWNSSQLPDRKGEMLLGIRPEKMRIAEQGRGRILARVERVEHLGAETLVGCTLGSERKSHVITDDLCFVRTVDDTYDAELGSSLLLDYDDSAVTWFDPITQHNIAI
jgi:multiple sugar transport system ATP-binding protein